MGKFSDTKQKLQDECNGTKKTFNKTMFDKLATAMLNDADYEKIEYQTKGGELVEAKSQPIADLRKAIIGSVAKAGGCDAAEQEKLVEEHQFPTLPMYDFVESSLREYLDLGKPFPLARQVDMKATLEMTVVKPTIKDVRRPGETETKKQRQGEFKKLKAKSTCPDNLKEDL